MQKLDSKIQTYYLAVAKLLDTCDFVEISNDEDIKKLKHRHGCLLLLLEHTHQIHLSYSNDLEKLIQEKNNTYGRNCNSLFDRCKVFVFECEEGKASNVYSILERIIPENICENFGGDDMYWDEYKDVLIERSKWIFGGLGLVATSLGVASLLLLKRIRK